MPRWVWLPLNTLALTGRTPFYLFIRGPRLDSASLAAPTSWHAFALLSLSRLGVKDSSRLGPRESRATAAARRPPSFRETAPLVGLRPRVLGPLIQDLEGLEASLLLVKPETVIRYRCCLCGRASARLFFIIIDAPATEGHDGLGDDDGGRHSPGTQCPR